MRAREFITEKVQEISLNDVYDGNMPDRDELIWNFVGLSDFDIPFTVRTIRPYELDEILCDNYGVDDVEQLFKKMQPNQEAIVRDYENDPNLSQQIIVMSGNRIIDGNHRALAAVLSNRPIKYIDVAEELDEDWKKALASAGLAGTLMFGGHQLMKQQPTPQQEPAAVQQTEPAQQEPEVKQVLPQKKPADPQVVKQMKTILKTPLAQALVKEAQQAGILGEELAQFLAQCAHETHNFRSLKEFGGRLDHKRYDIKHNPQLAKILGNTKPGDGFRYIGRGFIQLTGKDNYKRVQKALNLPIVSKPELVENPDIAAKIAVWYWQNRVAPKVDDFSDTAAATKPINSQLAGYDDRDEKFRAIANIMGL